MARWVMMVLALMTSGVAMAQEAAVVSAADLKVRTEQYYGRAVQIVGHVAQATREDASFGVDAGDAGIVTFSLWWGGERGTEWERALRTCGGGFRSDDECRVTVTGVVTKNESFPELFSLKNVSVKFLK